MRCTNCILCRSCCISDVCFLSGCRCYHISVPAGEHAAGLKSSAFKICGPKKATTSHSRPVTVAAGRVTYARISIMSRSPMPDEQMIGERRKRTGANTTPRLPLVESVVARLWVVALDIHLVEGAVAPVGTYAPLL